jgi:release factor glutamine methyltransferase
VTGQPVTLHALVIAGRERLLAAGLSPVTAAIDAEVLARMLLGWDRARYLADRADPAPEGFSSRYDAWLARRVEREPVAQIVGRREFWGRDFLVTRDVLTPRPETELVVEEVLARLGKTPGPLRVIDVGTGSGILAITLALEWPEALVIATDISETALAVAARNAETHGVSGRVRFVQADLLAGLAGPVDVVVSNPPYVPDGARPVLSRDVREYEPSVALFGGTDGFELIRQLLPQAARVLAPGGLLVHEFGAGHDERMRAAATGVTGLSLLTIRDDLQGIPRLAVLQADGSPE